MDCFVQDESISISHTSTNIQTYKMFFTVAVLARLAHYELLFYCFIQFTVMHCKHF